MGALISLLYKTKCQVGEGAFDVFGFEKAVAGEGDGNGEVGWGDFSGELFVELGGEFGG